MDFTIRKYKELLSSLIDQNYQFQSYNDFLQKPKERVVILRHDVDLLPLNSMRFAEIQRDFGVCGTYYFRAVPESWDENVIIKIAGMGHEIGYHYENLTVCDGDLELAIIDFKQKLKELRKLSKVTTICMHGSPMSKFDSKDLWKYNDYRDMDIIGEPYFDTDFDKVFYLTDTGRMWDGQNVSVRDRVSSSYKETYHGSAEIIAALKNDSLPNQLMFTFHPQRWHESYIGWTKELVMQNVKNIIKHYFFVPKNHK